MIVDRLTKSAHFLPIKNSDLVEKLVKLYVKEIVRLHGMLISIVRASNRASRTGLGRANSGLGQNRAGTKLARFF